MMSNNEDKPEIPQEADIDAKNGPIEEKKSEDPESSTDPDSTEIPENNESAAKSDSTETKEGAEEGNSGSEGAPGEDENEGPDDDEDAKNPAYIPRKGAFYMHDSRKDEGLDDKGEEGQRKSRADKKWAHDLYDDRQQRPKTAQELVRKGPPRERQVPQPPRPKTNGNGLHFKRTIVPSNAKKPERGESSNRNEQSNSAVDQNYDKNQNQNFRGGKRPTNVRTSDTRKPQTPPQNMTNGGSPKQPSTPSTPRASTVSQQVPPFSPHVAIVPPMIAPAAFVPAPGVPIAVVPVVPPATAPLPANYPHLRQPTDTVYFDPNSQSTVPRTPPQPREKRTLEIAPPTQ
ncbi:hypothetical protein FO519_002766 [Halicephalobus sp. NKZ332]|nr:hypothetical protein FO519_002766 [Halicephalobus sp. NKZ332]